MIADVLKAQGLRGDEDPQALALATCRAHAENFPVLSLAVEKGKRPALAALYAFCRAVDDLGDEAPGDRLALLDAWEADLLLVWKGTPEHPLLKALVPVVRDLELPDEPFRRLVQANRMDQTRTRHATFEDLREYCRHSADPVGHLVLRVYGYADPERDRLSDATCTALQLANFWQDVSRDLAQGRIYLPGEDLARFGVAEADLEKSPASPAVRSLLAFQVARARSLFAEGLALPDRLSGRARWAVASFSAGGLAVLDAIAAQGYDVIRKRPAVSGADRRRVLLSTAWRLLSGARGPAVCPSALRCDEAA